ncbi:MAG: hypothetical protein LQ345_005041 [Seirophora villosa]|nr:MAG: hypothetical protein LQ345_005041 [Seirophora villosa]
MSSAQPSQPSPPAPPTTSPPPPLSPDGTINNDSADPSFDPTSLDPDIDMAIDPSPTTQLPDAQLDGPAPDPSPTANGASEDTSKPPVQKDISLKDFLEKMDDYTPIIPDAVTSHHFVLAGLPPSSIPPPLTRLLALATQKFIADIAADAYQYSRMRASGNASSSASAGGSTAAAAAVAMNNPATAAVAGAGGQSQQQQQQGGGDGTAKGKAGAHVFGAQRAGYGGGGGGSSGRAVLTMEDLGCAVGEYGVNVKRAEFYR